MNYSSLLTTGNSVPDFIKKIPNSNLESWAEYCFTYKMLTLISIALPIVLLIIGFLIGRKTEFKFKFSIPFFEIKGKDKKTDDVKKKEILKEDEVAVSSNSEENYKEQIKTLETKLHKYDKQIGQLKFKNDNLVKANRSLNKSIDEKNKQIKENNEQSINNEFLILEIRNSYSKIEEIINNFKKTAYYLTDEVSNSNLRNFVDLVNGSEKELLKREILQEIFYNLDKDLPSDGKEKRISLMQCVKDNNEEKLKIIFKYGNFNCKTGDIVFNIGEGLAGKSIELDQIINISDVDSAEAYKQSAITINDYVKPKKHDATTSSLHIPISIFDTVVAVLNLTSSSVSAFSEEDVTIARLYSLKISTLLMLENLGEE